MHYIDNTLSIFIKQTYLLKLIQELNKGRFILILLNKVSVIIYSGICIINSRIYFIAFYLYILLKVYLFFKYFLY